MAIKILGESYFIVDNETMKSIIQQWLSYNVEASVASVDQNDDKDFHVILLPVLEIPTDPSS